MKRFDEDQDTYWLGLEQLNKDPAFLKKAENEFFSSPLKEGDTENNFDRRDFMKLMGASIALASAGCLRRPVQKIIPYNKKPPEVTEGIANYYTSSYFDGTQGLSILVKTREGRPLFVTGNEEFPMNRGGMTPRSVASTLSLYDPDRLRSPIRNLQNKERSNRETVGVAWEGLDAKINEALKAGGVRVLTGHTVSPSTRALISTFTGAFDGSHVEWAPVQYESLREAQKKSYGEEVVPRYRFDKAQFIVSIDCDFLSTYLSPAEFARDFNSNRNPDKTKQSRFVAFESLMTMTGMNADDRYRIKPSQHLTVALGLAAELVINQKKAGTQYTELLKPFSGAAAKLGMDPTAFAEVASGLWENRGKSLVIAGGLNGDGPLAVELHSAVNLLNSILDNDGVTVDGTVAPFMGLSGSTRSFIQLIADMNADKVKTLIIDGSINPVYQMPENLGFAKALKKVKTVIYTGNYLDETSVFADFVAPEGHSFENWNDFEFQKGLISIQQPTIRPMFETRSFQDSLIVWLKAASRGGLDTVENYYSYLKNRWKTVLSGSAGNLKGSGFEDRWDSLLQEGFYLGTQRENTGSARSFNASALNGIKPIENSDLELVLYVKASVGDGSFANNAWIQELPDPVTKIVWDNYALVSPEFAKKNKLVQGSLVTLRVADTSVQVPVCLQPGVHDQVIGLAVGYGRQAKSLKVANGVGKNAFVLAQNVNNKIVYSGLAVTVDTNPGSYSLACTQGHHSMEGRQIVVETTAAAYAKDKRSGIHTHTFKEDIWTPHKYVGHKWAMSIDLNSCIGCSTCMVACQSENNVPVVGKKYVLEGREMHWLRIDRYWKGDAENPDAVVQPLLCQHCENAPCERVCPVLATVHSDEGLNDMIYNRCVGTRYCSNNCPYKVRRFNWFNYTKKYNEENDTTHMSLNPEVTVRSRGVMEKCTFCVQRIKEGKNQAKDENRDLKDGEIKTACQSVCPTNAITFGDLSQETSEVSKLWASERQYMLLEEQNTKARVRYLSKIRNAKRAVDHHTAGEPVAHETAVEDKKNTDSTGHAPKGQPPVDEKAQHQGAGEHP